MVSEILAYLAWIILTIGAMAYFVHILGLDRPREVKIPVRKDDSR